MKFVRIDVMDSFWQSMERELYGDCLTRLGKQIDFPEYPFSWNHFHGKDMSSMLPKCEIFSLKIALV